MGGTDIIQSSPPPAPTAAQSAREFSEALPTILETQLKFQPQFDRQVLDSFRELGPEFARVTRETLEEFSPQLARLDEELAGQALELSEQGLSSDELDLFRNEFKALAGPNVSSGIGADFVARNLVRENLAARQQGQNLGLALQGKVPVSQAFQTPSNFQVANSFQPAFQTNTSAFGSVFGGAGRPLGFETGTQRFADIAGGVGSLFQGAGSLMTAGAA